MYVLNGQQYYLVSQPGVQQQPEAGLKPQTIPNHLAPPQQQAAGRIPPPLEPQAQLQAAQSGGLVADLCKIIERQSQEIANLVQTRKAANLNEPPLPEQFLEPLAAGIHAIPSATTHTVACEEESEQSTVDEEITEPVSKPTAHTGVTYACGLEALTAAAEGESRASTHACDYFAQFNPSAPSSYFEPGSGGMSIKQKVKRVRRQPIKPLLEADGIRQCAACGATETPKWRCGMTLCNACGLRNAKRSGHGGTMSEEGVPAPGAGSGASPRQAHAAPRGNDIVHIAARLNAAAEALPAGEAEVHPGPPSPHKRTHAASMATQAAAEAFQAAAMAQTQYVAHHQGGDQGGGGGKPPTPHQVMVAASRLPGTPPFGDSQLQEPQLQQHYQPSQPSQQVHYMVAVPTNGQPSQPPHVASVQQPQPQQAVCSVPMQIMKPSNAAQLGKILTATRPPQPQPNPVHYAQPAQQPAATAGPVMYQMAPVQAQQQVPAQPVHMVRHPPFPIQSQAAPVVQSNLSSSQGAIQTQAQLVSAVGQAIANAAEASSRAGGMARAII